MVRRYLQTHNTYTYLAQISHGLRTNTSDVTNILGTLNIRATSLFKQERRYSVFSTIPLSVASIQFCENGEGFFHNFSDYTEFPMSRISTHFASVEWAGTAERYTSLGKIGVRFLQLVVQLQPIWLPVIENSKKCIIEAKGIPFYCQNAYICFISVCSSHSPQLMTFQRETDLQPHRLEMPRITANR